MVRKRLNVGLPEPWAVSALEFETDLHTDLPVRWHTVRRPGLEAEAHVRGTDEAAVAAALVAACTDAADRARNPGNYGDVGVD